jgi:hypothetical protein
MSPMTDEQFVAAFESTELPDDQFSHTAHVRVAWWYLQHSPLPVAMQRFGDALKRFATSKGAAGKYHETITVAYMLILAERLHAARDLSWPQFATANPDLFERPSVLAKYYRDETLASDRARRGFVMPDR